MDTKALALFPLELVVFPTEKINLHIFEPRYKQLIQDCDQKGIHFGIPPFLDGKLMQTGTEMRLEKIEKTYPDGKMDIRTRAVGLFSIEGNVKVLPGKLYKGATVHPLPWDKDGDLFKNIEILKLVRKLYKVMHISKRLPEKDRMPLSAVIGHQIGLTLHQEYALLSIAGEEARQDFILEHLRTLVPIAREIEEMRKKVQMNGHFREFPTLEF